MIDLIGKDRYVLSVDTILNGTYNPPKDKLSPLQIAYFRNLQWENKQELKGVPTMISVNQNKTGSNIGKNASVYHLPTAISVTIYHYSLPMVNTRMITKA